MVERGPLHERLRQQLTQQIAAGRWQPGERIPSERVLAETYGVSLITVRRALRDLALEGVVVRRVPNGTFVATPATRPRLLGVATFGGVDAVNSRFFGPMLLGMQEAARERARLQLLAAPAGAAKAAWLKQLAEERDVEGAIVVTADPLAYEDVAPLDLRGFPYVLLNRRIPGHAVWCVVADDYAVARRAVDYLYALGHRRIAHVAGPPHLVTAADRVRGFLDGLRAHGLLETWHGAGSGVDAPILVLPEAAPVAYGRFSYGTTIDDESGYEAMRALLARRPPPTAAFAAADTLAAGVYRALRDAGLRVPDDVSVVGMSNEPFTALLDPPLTTFDYRHRDMGRESVHLLLDQIGGRVPGGAATPEDRTRVVEAILVERASCRALTERSELDQRTGR